MCSLSDDLSDDVDIRREIKNLFVRNANQQIL